VLLFSRYLFSHTLLSLSLSLSTNSKWCGPCKASKPQLQALAASYASDPNINVSCGIAYEHNLGDDIQNYRVRAFPTYALFQKSSEVGRVEGVNFEGIKSLVERYCEAHDFGTGNSLGGGGNSGAVSAADVEAQRLARFGGGAASPQPPAEKKEAEQQTTATRKG
jgi:thiol-disulfide isomerase/thioredoxin